jgi:exopolysaccharide biosynthesis polyprenyl glycosylphosphotransferase
VADVVGIACAIGFTTLTVGWAPWLLLGLPIFIALGKIHNLYDGDEARTNATMIDDVAGVFNATTIAAFLMLAAALVLGDPIDVETLVIFWASSVAAVACSRFAARGMMRRTTTYRQHAIILGAGDVGQLIARKIIQHPEYGINLLGFVDSNPRDKRPDLGDLTILGETDDLVEIVRANNVERVMVAFSGETNEETLSVVRSLRDFNVQIDIVPRLFEAVGPSADIHAIEGLPLLGLPSVRITRTSRVVKRMLDIVGASCLLVIASPVFAYIAFRVRRTSPGPVIFRQERLGMNLRPFEMLKFRTMNAETDPAVHREYFQRAMDTRIAPNENGLYKLERDDSVTAIGRWLRRTSLDELPQLFNVLRGDMSLVGPRPCIAYETEFFEPHHFERFLMPQGITGLWQVEGRGLMSPREALDLDVAYARGWSLRLDLSLLARTFWQVAFGRGTA